MNFPRFARLQILIVLLLSPVLMNVNTARAGKELITVSCGAQVAYDSETNSAIVPVTVTLTNGSPDTIDMVYYNGTNQST